MPCGASSSQQRGKKLCFLLLIEAEAPEPVRHEVASPWPVSNIACQMEDAEPADSFQPEFQEVMAAIASCQATLTNKIEAVRQDLLTPAGGRTAGSALYILKSGPWSLKLTMRRIGTT